MSVSFLQATSDFLDGLMMAIFTGSVTPGVHGALGSLADIISTS